VVAVVTEVNRAKRARDQLHDLAVLGPFGLPCRFDEHCLVELERPAPEHESVTGDEPLGPVLVDAVRVATKDTLTEQKQLESIAAGIGIRDDALAFHPDARRQQQERDQDQRAGGGSAHRYGRHGASLEWVRLLSPQCIAMARSR